ncbi:Ig-like domain-containing protein [Bifidobacterium samirii]|uniref:Ig-like domain-containing protein n=1 Tax=Bifidobacterium samirii TaxID=2306974 RepID=UPI000F7E2D26|nr:Ig-like domain-containing protein [Bifidobacterium samirii]
MAVLLAAALLASIVMGALRAQAVSGGDVRFDDGTVWITSDAHRQAVRFNAAAGQPDVSLPAPEGDFDVVQHGDLTLLVGDGLVQSVDPASAEVTASVETGSGFDVKIGGASVALVETGNGSVWAFPASEFGAWSPDSRPADMTVGADGFVAVGHDGLVYGYRPEDGTVLCLDADGGGPATAVASFGEGDRFEVDDVTVVGSTPVVVADGVIRWPSGSVDTGVRERLTLQAPDADGAQGPWVAAVGRDRLVTADLSGSGGDAGMLVFEAHADGEPARPVSSGGCVHAAWGRAERNYLAVCSPGFPDGGRSRNATVAAGDVDAAIDGAGEAGIASSDAAADAGGGFVTLASVSASSDLRFRVNHRRVLLNDAAFGDVWAPSDRAEPLDVRWGGLFPDDVEEASDERRSDDVPVPASECTPDADGVLANDDAFGVRSGRSRLIDVLANDEQTGCSALSIAAVGAVQGSGIRVTPVLDGRYLQVDATGVSPGARSFSYEVEDGAGHASSARVSVTVVAGDGNHAPQRSATVSEHELEQGASVEWNALEAFSDPDGDPLMLVAASPEAGSDLTVTHRSDGLLTIEAGTVEAERVGVELIASDGSDLCAATAYVSVRAAGTLRPTTDPLSVRAVPGDTVHVDLTDSVHGTSADPVRLVDVSVSPAASVALDAGMALSFSAQDSGTYDVRYTAAQGGMSVSGHVRVDVAPAVYERSAPVVVDDVVVLDRDGNAVVDPLGNDTDPTGGVPAVAAVEADAGSGVSVGIVDHRRVHLSVDVMPDAPVRVPYTAVNEVGSSNGTIVLLPAAVGGSAAPRAVDADVSVRCGGTVSVDVLQSMESGDDRRLALSDASATDGALVGGLAFVADGSIRYRAGDRAGDYPVRYTVEDDEGRMSSGTVTFHVHERDAAGKPAPKPHDVEARARAGSTVRIEIPLSGIDADGDDVILLGLGHLAPTLGRVTEIGSDWLTYEAYPDSSGTDTFAYAVEDWTGRRAQATVRVGVFVSDRSGGVHARDDAVAVRPGTRMTVPVLDNDIAGDGSTLMLSGAESEDLPSVSVESGAVSFTAPDRECVSYITYTARDEAGFSDTALLRVETDADAPPPSPTASDHRVPASDTVDRRSVDVDVSALVTSPSGDIADLVLSVPDEVASIASADSTDGRHVVSIVLGDEPTAVPYTVTDGGTGMAASAFLQVPAYGVFPPARRPQAPTLVVDAGDTLLIDIADQVRVGPGKRARIDSPDSVSSTRNDADPYVDDHTLRFTAPRGYAGPASVTFTAVDGSAGGDAIVSSAVITLPITVIDDGTPAPVFSAPVIEVCTGEDPKTVDLSALTRSTSSASDDSTYVYEGGSVTGTVTSSLSRDGLLSVEAAQDAGAGSLVSIPFSIRYDGGVLRTGVTVRVTQSARPFARIGTRTVTVSAGEDATVDVLADSYNPFPETPLHVVGCTADAPARFAVSCDGTTVSVHAVSGLGATTGMIRVDVQDATRSRQRQVTATITVKVIDRPAAPLMGVTAVQASDGAVELSWIPGADNGAPIVEYEVRWTTGARSCAPADGCRIDGLVNGTTYAFTVRARNAVGWSDDSAVVTAVPDRVPPPPASVTVTGGYRSVHVAWAMPDYAGSRPDRYTVTLTLSTGYTRTLDVDGPSTDFPLPQDAVTDGCTASATVRAANARGIGPPAASARSASPWSDPDPMTLELRQDGGSVTATVIVGDLRNAGCRSVSIDGVDVPCDAPAVTWTLDESDYGIESAVTATMIFRSEGIASASATRSIVPVYDVRPPASASIQCRTERCIVRWAPSGLHDGFVVKYGGTEHTVPSGTTDMSFDAAPGGLWLQASVAQTFRSRTGPYLDAEPQTAPASHGPDASVAALPLLWVPASAGDSRPAALHLPAPQRRSRRRARHQSAVIRERSRP